MKFKICIQFILALVLFVSNEAFSNVKNGRLNESNIQVAYELNVSSFTKELTVYHQTVDGLSVYTFVPEIKTDQDTFLAVENRLSVLVEGFVSLKVNQENQVQLTLDPAIVSQERVAFSLSVLMKIYEYSNYVIK